MVADAPSGLRCLPMTAEDADEVARWRYPDRWQIYDVASAAGILAELDRYWSVCDANGALVGFMCVDSAARVPGLEAAPPIVDIGIGMRPDLVGRGMGRTFGAAVLDHVGRRYPGRPLRAVIQSWNLRSVRLAVSNGFIDTEEMISTQDGREVVYRIMVRPAAVV